MLPAGLCKLVRRQLAAAIEFPSVASGRSWNDGYVEERWFSGGILKNYGIMAGLCMVAV